MNSQDTQIVLVHIPKTAGSSLKESLIESIGEENIYFDYRKPLSSGPGTRKFKCLIASLENKKILQKVIFGHFLVGKYAHFSPFRFYKRKDRAYIVFLRDPLQRAVSHYYFWKRTNDREHKVWRRFTKENWSLEQFLLSKEHENFQSQFLWRFPIRNFDFIGLAEYYEESLKMLSIAFPFLNTLSVHADNVNPRKEAGEMYKVDPALAKEFMKRNKLDYELYRSAQERFEHQRVHSGIRC